MPTGYTADVVDGKVTEFKDFAMQCARAFGALITMRDDPMDAPIPEDFQPSDYHVKALATARARLSELRAMSTEQANAAAAAAFQEETQRRSEYEQQRALENGRLQDMLDKVREWQPPTIDHEEMKKFMREQLQISMNGPLYSEPPQKLTGTEWHAQAIASANRDIEYHSAENAKEIERSRGRGEWIKSLRASLNGASHTPQMLS